MDRFLTKRSDNSEVEAAGGKKARLTDPKIAEANRVIFGHSSFRPQQEEIINTVHGRQQDVFVVMPTGGGKSLLFQLPACLSKGVTIVISPLLSLIEEQVDTLLRLPSGGVPAAFLTSSCKESMIDQIFQDLGRIYSGNEPYLKILYTTPERVVKSERMKAMFDDMSSRDMLARFVIDEAHCVSAWGHDFRKDYALLGKLRDLWPEVPIIALTATARNAVADDVMKILKIPICKKFSCGFDRPNLYFEVRPKPQKNIDTMKCVLDYIKTYSLGSIGTTGIVYCMTRKETEATSDYLRSNGLRVDYYHAGQNHNDRNMVQSAWYRGDIDVVCATIAYGMGIDKPSVRFVIHTSLAKSIEGYYQEAGRAGRDGDRSECILFYKPSDVVSLQRLIRIGKRNIPKRDMDRLVEMQEYCEEQSSCRRKVFAATFGSILHASPAGYAPPFKRCEDMCDNCKARHGIARRGEIDTAMTTEFLEDLDCWKDSRSKLATEDSKANSTSLSRNKFMKASEYSCKVINLCGGDINVDAVDGDYIDDGDDVRFYDDESAEFDDGSDDEEDDDDDADEEEDDDIEDYDGNVENGSDEEDEFYS